MYSKHNNIDRCCSRLPKNSISPILTISSAFLDDMTTATSQSTTEGLTNPSTPPGCLLVPVRPWLASPFATFKDRLEIVVVEVVVVDSPSYFANTFSSSIVLVVGLPREPPSKKSSSDSKSISGVSSTLLGRSDFRKAKPPSLPLRLPRVQTLSSSSSAFSRCPSSPASDFAWNRGRRGMDWRADRRGACREQFSRLHRAGVALVLEYYSFTRYL